MSVRLEGDTIHYEADGETPTEVAKRITEALNRESQVGFEIVREGTNSPAIPTPGGFVAVRYGDNGNIHIDVSRVGNNVTQTIKKELSNGSPHGASFHYHGGDDEVDRESVAKILDDDRVKIELNDGEVIEGDVMFVVDLSGSTPELTMRAYSSDGENIDDIEMGYVMDEIISVFR